MVDNHTRPNHHEEESTAYTGKVKKYLKSCHDCVVQGVSTIFGTDKLKISLVLLLIQEIVFRRKAISTDCFMTVSLLLNALHSSENLFKFGRSL